MTTTAKVRNGTYRAMGASRSGARVLMAKTNKALDKARRAVTQQDAFEAYNDALEDMARTVAHLYSQLEELQDVVSGLAQSESSGPK